MADTVLKGRKIQVKQGLRNQYTDDLLDVGEFGLITDTRELRIGIGNGATLKVLTENTAVANRAMSAFMMNEPLLSVNTRLSENDLNYFKNDRDENGIYRQTTHTRFDGTTYSVAELSNPDKKGNYLTSTLNYYDDSGEVVVETLIWTLTYDEDGEVISKVLSK